MHTFKEKSLILFLIITTNYKWVVCACWTLTASQPLGHIGQHHSHFLSLTDYLPFICEALQIPSFTNNVFKRSIAQLAAEMAASGQGHGSLCS